MDININESMIDNNILRNLKPRKKILKCIVCGKEFWLKNKRKTCSDECLIKIKPKYTKEERKKRNSIKSQKWYQKYKLNPEWVEKQKIRNLKYQKINRLRINMQNKERYHKDIELSRKKARDWYSKRKKLACG